jgi:hypothetical protein
MRWRVDMRSPLADMTEKLCDEARVLVGIERSNGFVWETRPVGYPGGKRVRQIDKSMRVNRSISAHQVPWRLGMSAQCEYPEEQSDCRRKHHQLRARNLLHGSLPPGDKNTSKAAFSYVH